MKKRHTSQHAAAPERTGQSEPASAPLTPSDVLTQACACCGAILPAPLSRLDAIPGQEHLRRAVTVALTGNHPITFLGSGSALADALAFGRISRHYGVTAYVTTPCICGNAGDPYLACRCTPDVLVAWQRRPAFQAALATDIVVEAASCLESRQKTPSPDGILMGFFFWQHGILPYTNTLVVRLRTGRMAESRQQYTALERQTCVSLLVAFRQHGENIAE